MKRDAFIVLIGLGLAALPLVVGSYWVGLLTQALIFGGFALGLDVLVGYTGMPSLGHAAFFGLAGYGTALAITRWGLNPWLAAGIGIVLSLAVALAFAPLAVRLRGLTFLTVTLAFGQVAWGLATRGGEFTGGENGIPNVARPSLGFWDLQTPVGFYLFTVFWLIILTLLVSRFVASAVGLSLLGVRDSDTRMAALGYNVQARRALAFVVAAGVGAIYGMLSVFYNQFIGPGSLDWRLSAQMLLSVVIGGAGSLWGPFIAGTGLHVLKTLLTGQTERWPMVLGALYVITVVLLPGGLASLARKFRRDRPAAAAKPLDSRVVREP
ncbi:MAG TPA: branched-chain amino acid ABC transporter permease [Chloroflexi bacterium]|nr:branched-chain amino acid ABC transporter permease [Chloroflexota bacterium]